MTKVEHLMDDSGKFLSLAAFQTIHDLTARPLSFLGIISSIKLLQRNIPHKLFARSPIKHERFLPKFFNSLYHEKVNQLTEVNKNGKMTSHSKT